ncbi:MAG: Na(+)-translocating NADH-quinone reductase subunit A [Paracoccus sp. (in: a-proteobacteria)]|nr:Na(+)-translocating NADH-quinone reductase subunit A [Paracoccus sp. (in: a-proteobacteria)]
MNLSLRRGLTLPVNSDPPKGRDPVTVLTDEAALGRGFGPDFRVDPLVQEGDVVAHGAPILRSRRHPEMVITAPMAGRIARLDLGPGRVLSQVLMFRDEGAGRHEYDRGEETPEALRSLMLETGLWTAFRSRPFGRFPLPGEQPSAIFVMAHDTRPLAAPARDVLRGQEDAFARGLDALIRLAEAPVWLVQGQGRPLARAGGRLRVIHAGALHPEGLAGGHIHRHHPATPDRRVWEIDAQEVAALGLLLETGLLPETRVVSVAGPGLSRPQLVRCQIGADMRGLVAGLLTPGPRAILSGALPAAQEARYLRLRDRIVTVIPRPERRPRDHWFRAALGRAARPLPIIPTAAVEQSMAGGIPVMALLRALSSGDHETAVALGALSLLEEDMALIDYITAAEPRFAGLLRACLDAVAIEEGG